MSGIRASGMKRKNVLLVMRANLPEGEWMTASEIVEFIHDRESTGVRCLHKKFFPPTGRSLSQKLRGARGIERRTRKRRSEGSGPLTEYRVIE
jgi:hypothetical protein